MNADLVVIATVVFLAFSVLLIPLMPARLKSLTALFVIILNALITTIPAIRVLAGGEFSLILNGGANFGDVRLVIRSPFGMVYTDYKSYPD